MSSVRKALRAGNVRKDTYERLLCNDCSVPLNTASRGGVGWTRACPECGREWRQLK